MKKGWEYKKLGDVCNRITDGSHNPPKGVVKSENIMLSSQNVQNDYLDMSNVRYISDVDYRLENQRTQASMGDVLLTIVGTIGRTCVLKGTEGNLTFQRSVAVLKPSKEIISRFLMYFLFSQNSSLNTTAHGAAQKGIYLKQLGNIGIFYPPLSEQQSIVNYLDSAFAKIDAMKANAEKALNEAKALFQASLKEMLEPKEGWEEKKLIKEFSLKSGENLSAKNQVIGPYPVYGGNGITGYHNQYNLSGDQILIGRVGALCGNIHYIKERIWVTDNAFVVNNISSSWNMLFLSYELEYINLNQYASQTAQPVISNKSMKDLSIFQPSLSEQQSIVATLDSLKSKVDRLQANYEKISQECDALKQAILRQVFE